MARYQESMRRRMWTIRKKKFRLPPNWRSSCSIPPPLIITILGKTNFPPKNVKGIFEKLFRKMKFHKICITSLRRHAVVAARPLVLPHVATSKVLHVASGRKKVFFSNNWLRETAVSSKRVFKAHYYYLFHFSGICAMLSILSLLASMIPLGYKSISHVLILNKKVWKEFKLLEFPCTGRKARSSLGGCTPRPRPS